MTLFRTSYPFLGCLVAVAATSATVAAPSQVLRPNVLWITCEDTSPTLGCYGDRYARTPHLDRLASQGVRWSRAFATASVCAPARSCLITGMYAASLGTQNLRSTFPVPAAIKGFPTYLRQAGYFTSNNVKTDYNLANEAAFIRESWDRCDSQAHWRQRRPGQPFFSVFNIMDTHQSRSNVWSFEQFEKEIGSKLAPAERHDPAKAIVPPYYPDTPLVRRTLARCYDCITAMDKEAGRLLAQLDEDGLADDTIVFFYGDGGVGMPRGKRTNYDTGLRVPLIIRFPEKFRNLAPLPAGAMSDRLVSFVDFAPTVLSLAGLSAPEYMQGQAFLGPKAGTPRQYVYGARDRVDEAFDVSRSVRDARWLYVRNYMPHLSWMQPEGFSDQSLMRRELVELAAHKKLNAAQWTYAAPTRPLEELFDTDADPCQLHNLAASSAHQETLERMRRQLRQWLLEVRDVGFLAEHDVSTRSRGQPPFTWARGEGNYPLERVLAAADLVGRPASLRQQMALLGDTDSGVRSWAAVGLRAAGECAAEARPALIKALDDASASVRIQAAAALASSGDADRPLRVLVGELRGPDDNAAVEAARALQLLGAQARPVAPQMREVLKDVKEPGRGGDAEMFIRFALQAALEKLSDRDVPQLGEAALAEAHRKAQQFIDNETQFHLGVLPTEQSNPKSAGLAEEAQRDLERAVRMLQAVDADVLPKAEKVLSGAEFKRLAAAMRDAIGRDKRVCFSGCGATGRLSILLESCWRRCCQGLRAQHPPLAAQAARLEDRVVSIMTGGDYALVRSVENFEDFQVFGRRQVQEAGLGKGDVLVAITEGGETSSVIGTVWQALDSGAEVFFLFNNPADVLARHIERSRRVIEDPRIAKLDLSCGPMAVAGSTRMQATTSELLVAGAALEMALIETLQGALAPGQRAAVPVTAAAPGAYARRFAELLEDLADPKAVTAISGMVRYEEQRYRRKGLVTYMADQCLLDIFTDTTERSPTFMLPRFRRRDDRQSPPPWAFVKDPLRPTEAAWREVLRRSPRCLSWDAETYRQLDAPARLRQSPPRLSAEEMLQFAIGNEDEASRHQGPDDAAVLIAIGEETEGLSVPGNALRKAFASCSQPFAHRAALAIGPAAPPADLAPTSWHVPLRLRASPLRLWDRLGAKLVLNTVSTATMARLGRLQSNWMVCVEPTNKKLIDRGTRLVAELAGVDYRTACYALHETMEALARRSHPAQEKPSPVALTIGRLKAKNAK